MSPAAPARLGERERTWLLAMAMAATALGIDLLLPAFGDIRGDYGLAPDATQVTGLVTAFFVGLAVGQPLFGPLSDRYGRKPLLMAGYVVYAIGAIATAVAPTLPLAIVARFVWGVGAASGRAVTVAIVRDRSSGEAMSRQMSLIMSIFILVPVVAPSLGAAMLLVVSWRWLAVFCAAYIVALWLWTTRLAESLAPEDRRATDLRSLWTATREVLTTPAAARPTFAMVALFGVFSSYLASSEIITDEVFGLGEAFPLIFGGLVIVMGAGMLLNARLVERFGTPRLVRLALLAYLAAAAVLVGISVASDGTPPALLWALPLMAALFTYSMLIPNMNALAMEPVGHIAGLASSVIGTLQVAGGALLGAVIDAAFDGTVTPLSLGFLVTGLVAAAITLPGIATPREAVAGAAAG